MITEVDNEEEIKLCLLKELKNISTSSKIKGTIIIKKKNGRKITIISKTNHDVKKFGLAIGQFVQVKTGPDMRFSRERIGLVVGLNFYNKRKLWFLFHEDGGITSLDTLSRVDFFSQMEKDGNLLLLNPVE